MAFENDSQEYNEIELEEYSTGDTLFMFGYLLGALNLFIYVIIWGMIN